MLAPALAEVPDVDEATIARHLVELEASPPTIAIFQTGVGTRALFSAADSLGNRRLRHSVALHGFFVPIHARSGAIRNDRPPIGDGERLG